MAARNHRKKEGISMRRRAFIVVFLLSLSSIVGADSLWSGSCVQCESHKEGHLMMTVEEAGISKAEISPDGKVLKIENDYPVLRPEVRTIASWRSRLFRREHPDSTQPRRAL